MRSATRDRGGPGDAACSSISTASRPTTTRSATTPATRCSPALGRALAAAVEGRGAAYRLGGDEFCLLLDGELSRRPDRDARGRGAQRARRGLRRHRLLRRSSRSPPRPTSSEAALQLADERMYAHKDSRRATSRRQARDVLVQVLAEREPELRRHMADVAELAARTGRELGLEHRAARRRSPAPRSCTTSARSPCPTTSSTSPARSTTSSGGSCASTRWSASASSPPRPPSPRSPGSCA